MNFKYNGGKSSFIWSEYYKSFYSSLGHKNRILRQKIWRPPGFSIQIYVHPRVFGARWLKVFCFHKLVPSHLKDLSFYKTSWYQFKCSPSFFLQYSQETWLASAEVKLCPGFHNRLHFPHTRDASSGATIYITNIQGMAESKSIWLLGSLWTMQKLRLGLRIYYDLQSNLGFFSGGKDKKGRKTM